ncbi:MAG: hypothetical protein HETSPECPRED_000372 [Heterodermia speciosa]|uniref:Uncharacterized protein n=1 Tax=Heterodermia speciosa TaxID=116794 RepID=A0A8H3IFA0_9LECA|nr:MAG: hypothetical protein HETSPECPRED_000372 [Heterodermia speciosa]
MHIPISLITALATAFVATLVSAQASTGLPNLSIDFDSLVPTATYPASVKSSYLSELAAKASSQVTNSAFKAEISKISEASGRDLVADFTKAAAGALWSGTHTSPLPAWLSALPTTGYALSVLNGDIDAIFKSEIADTKSATSVNAKLSSTASSLKSEASSLSSSLGSKASSIESKISTSVSSATQTSTGGAAPAHVTGVMALGAVMAGGVGIMVGAAGF